MCLPLITLCGQAFASRMATSLLACGGCAARDHHQSGEICRDGCSNSRTTRWLMREIPRAVHHVGVAADNRRHRQFHQRSLKIPGAAWWMRCVGPGASECRQASETLFVPGARHRDGRDGLSRVALNRLIADRHVLSIGDSDGDVGNAMAFRDSSRIEISRNAGINFVSGVDFVYFSLIYFVASSAQAKNLAVCNSRNRGVLQMALSNYTLAFRENASTKNCRHVCTPTTGKPS